MDSKKTRLDCVYWIHVPQGRDRWQYVVKSNIIFQIAIKVEIFLDQLSNY